MKIIVCALVDTMLFLPQIVFLKKKKKTKAKEKVYLSAVKLIRRLVVSTCQTDNSYAFINCFYTYEPNVHYNNPYLSVDRLKKKEGDE